MGRGGSLCTFVARDPLAPLDQARVEQVVKVGAVGEDAQAVEVAAVVGGRVGAPVDEASLVVAAGAGEREHVGFFDEVALVAASGHELELQFFGFHGAGHDIRGDAERIGAGHGVLHEPLNLDLVDAHAGEARSDVGFPCRERAGQQAVLGAHFHVALRGRPVTFFEVLAHHAGAAVLRAQRSDAVFHARDPAVGQSVVGAFEVERRHFVFQQRVEAFGVGVVALLGGRVVDGCDARPDGPAVEPVVAFAPPAVGHAQIERAVGGRFLAAGAAGFVGAARRVQPDVAALHHGSGDVEVVVGDEEEFAEEFVSAGEHDFLDQVVALCVGRMGLAGKDEDHGTPGVREDFRQPRQIGERERGAFVGRETARETDHQRRLFPFGGGFVERFGRRFLEQLQQDFFLFLFGLPEIGVGDL